MAEERDDADKTEDPSQRKLDEALKRGDVVKSHEVNTWFVIAGAALVMLVFSGPMSRDLTVSLRGLLANAHQIRADGFDLFRLSSRLTLEVLAAIVIPFLVLFFAAIAGNMIQHQLVWSGEQMKPKASKISPIAGMKRMFSKHALANFIKGVIKLAVVGAVMALILWPERNRLESLISMEPIAALKTSHSLALSVMGAVVAIIGIVAALDFLWQYRQWFERQKMSLRELKEEFRQTEGDPVIKGKIKQLRQNRMRKRMIAAVPKASVVITNPTHYAVALQYDRGMNAPVCLAKGVDGVALKIREVASAHNVPVVENPPLARALHATVEIEREIPPEHYKAVAEVISYVMRLRRGFRR